MLANDNEHHALRMKTMAAEHAMKVDNFRLKKELLLQQLNNAGIIVSKVTIEPAGDEM